MIFRPGKSPIPWNGPIPPAESRTKEWWDAAMAGGSTEEGQCSSLSKVAESCAEAVLSTSKAEERKSMEERRMEQINASYRSYIGEFTAYLDRFLDLEEDLRRQFREKVGIVETHRLRSTTSFWYLFCKKGWKIPKTSFWLCYEGK